MDISFIIVNYKSEQFLKRCVASIRAQVKAAKYEIIVVNNDKAPLLDIPDAKIIETNDNFGFAKACNIGARAASGKILFFLNPDTELLDSSIEKIIRVLDNPTIGIAAPRLVTSSGAIQPWSVGYEINLLNTLSNNLGYIKSRDLWAAEASGEVDWASGAALVITKELFLQIGGFDEKFFMYFEDVDLCKRVRNLGKKIIVLPEVKILHLGGKSVTDKQEQKQQYYASQDYYFQKHFRPLSAFLIKLLRKTFLLLQRR